MPVEIRYEKTEYGNGVVVEYSGYVNGDTVIQTVGPILESKEFTELDYWISDRTKCELFDVNADTARVVSKMTKSAAATNLNLCVVLVSPSALSYGMSRMFQMLIDDVGLKTYITETLAEARDLIRSCKNAEKGRAPDASGADDL